MDPFVGTGSILVAASHHGAYTMGLDIDYKLLRYGKLDSAGLKHDIWTNFSDYNLQSPSGIVACDLNRAPFRKNLEEVCAHRNSHAPTAEAFFFRLCILV